MTLNEIVDNIADPLNRTFDVHFKERIKSRIKTLSSVLIRRDVEKNGTSNHYIINIVVKLALKDLGTCNDFGELITTDCKVLTSINKIPKPIRQKLSNDFFYVGTVDGSIEFSQTNFENFNFTKYNKFTSKTIKYFVNGDYISIINNKRIKNIRLSYAFENFEQAINYCKNSNGNCYTEDSEYPLSLDMIEIIIQQLLKENYITTNIEENERVEFNDENLKRLSKIPKEKEKEKEKTDD